MAKYCGKCGSKLDEKTRLCPKCRAVTSIESSKGRKIPQQTSNERKGTTKVVATGRKRLVILLLGFIVVCIGLVSALVLANVIHVPVLSNILMGKSRYEKLLTDVIEGESSVNLIDSEGNEISSLTSGETSQKILASISFEVDVVERQEGKSVVTVRFTVPDIVALSKEYVDLEERNTDFLHWLQAELDGEYRTMEILTNITFVEQESEIYMVADANLYNALTGGALEFFTENQESAYESLKEGELE